MNLRDRRGLKQAAAQILEQSGSNHKQLVLLVSVITAGLSLLMMLLGDGISALISRQVGLASMGTRTMLETVSAVFNVAIQLASVYLGVGYLYAMLQISRQQPADQKSLLWGFRHAFPVLRLYILRTLILVAWAILAVYAASFVVTMLPWSAQVMEPAVQLILSGADMSDPEVMLQVVQSTLPVVLILIAAGVAAMLPQMYSMRMADYTLMDQPEAGARVALYRSRQLTRGNRVSLFLLDLSFWWYFALILLAEIPLYLPQLLGASGPVAEYGGVLLYAAATVAIQYSFMNRMQVTLCLSYKVLQDAHTPPSQSVSE